MRYRIIIRLALCSLALVFIAGCGEDLPIFTETLAVNNLAATQTSIGVGETTTVNASVDYSGDETILLYTWTAEAGQIHSSGSSATYIAPGTPGTYTVSLRVTDGVVIDEKTIWLTVSQQSVESLVLDLNTYWPAVAKKDKLAYNVNIKGVVSERVLLHYDITQDQAPFDVFLSIQIGDRVVLPEMAIGAEQPSTAKRTIDDIDVTGFITGPGRYIVTFYILTPGDVVVNGWLMNEAKIIGVTGTSDPQQ